MNSMKNKKVHNSEAPIPGCLGRMVNLLDIINPGVTGNKLLMDKPHYNGSSLTRSRSDVARSLSPIGDPLEDKFIVSELWKKPVIRTPMKMLIDDEMSKEVDPKHNPPNLVAKLMGLDALPRQQSDSVVHRSQSQICKTNNALHSKETLESRQTDSRDSNKLRKGEAKFIEQKEYNDIYEIWKQAQRKKFVKDKSPQRSRCAKDIDEEKMAFIWQKFVEAKRLVTNEKLRQSKGSQNALEFLSSNQDLLLKCLQDPSSPYTQQMYEKYIIPVSVETKRITVLKPAKSEEDEKNSVSETKNEKQAKKSSSVSLAHGRSKSNDERSSTFPYWDADDPLPTRIVVLKPSIWNAQDCETAASPDSSSLKIIQGEDYFTETDVCDSHDSREVAKGIARLMQEQNLGGLSDETMLSSLFSNGYTGDENSNYKSDKEYDGESDSEVMSQTSRHSWDYINRFSSPFSSSSCSRPSCSPESSVCREAKRRLSERWAVVASHENPSEQRRDRRSCSTLGEMLAMSDATNNLTSEEVDKKEKARGSTSCITHDLVKDENMLESPKSLFRSKSVPVSSSVLYGSRLNVELSGPKVGKPVVSREKAKPKSTITSFTGRVSSLFFKKNKKVKNTASKIEQSPHVSTTDTLEPCPEKSLGETLKHVARKASEECSHTSLQGKNEAIDTNGAILSVWRPAKFKENHDQPSPISVLETPCGEDNITALEFAWNSKLEQGAEALSHQLSSNLIDKSPPIGSASRTIAWKDLCSDSITPFATAHSVVPLGPQTEEDWFLFVQALLADIGIDDVFQSETYFTGWHSPDSPLDPMLREKYVNLSNKGLVYEANRRQWRSSRKLMYDCVNAVLADITRYRLPETRYILQGHTSVSSKGHHPAPLTDAVWTKIKEWIAYDARRLVGDDGDSNNRLLVELAVKSEVVGKEWDENMCVEMDKVGKEIEEKLLEELVEDAVISLTGRGS